MSDRKHRAGDEVIWLSSTRPDGTQYVSCYVYDTAASWSADDCRREGHTNIQSKRAPWDGVTFLSLDNGD